LYGGVKGLVLPDCFRDFISYFIDGPLPSRLDLKIQIHSWSIQVISYCLTEIPEIVFRLRELGFQIHQFRIRALVLCASSEIRANCSNQLILLVATIRLIFSLRRLSSLRATAPLFQRRQRRRRVEDHRRRDKRRQRRKEPQAGSSRRGGAAASRPFESEKMQCAHGSL
jgi:hypothetical protein